MTHIQRARLLSQELSDIRRDFHRHPELAFQEMRTAEAVAGMLEDLGFRTRRGVGVTGVVGDLENGDGPPAR